MKFLNKIILISVSFIIPCIINAKTYIGTVTPLVVQDIATGSDASYYGTIEYIASKGSLIRPKITDLNGNIVDPGTIVMEQGLRYWSAIVNADKANMVSAVQDVLTATANLKRYNKLAPSGAESIEHYQQYLYDYYKYLGAYLSEKGTLSLDKEVLDSRKLYAPFEGYVSNVMYTLGKATNNPETVEVTQLNPIGIDIKMPKSEVNKITPATPITIYIPGTNKKQGVYNGFSCLTKDGILIVTKNYQKKIPKTMTKNVKFNISDIYPVEYLYVKHFSDKLCLPKNAILKDKKGYFVWKAVNRKLLQPGKPFIPVFKVQKIYITPGNEMRLFDGRIYFQSIENNKYIEFQDVIISHAPDKLQSGDIVAIQPKRYILMPNESVKVDIDI